MCLPVSAPASNTPPLLLNCPKSRGRSWPWPVRRPVWSQVHPNQPPQSTHLKPAGRPGRRPLLTAVSSGGCTSIIYTYCSLKLLWLSEFWGLVWQFGCVKWQKRTITSLYYNFSLILALTWTQHPMHRRQKNKLSTTAVKLVNVYNRDKFVHLHHGPDFINAVDVKYSWGISITHLVS